MAMMVITKKSMVPVISMMVKAAWMTIGIDHDVVDDHDGGDDELDQLPNDAFAPESFYKTQQDFEFATRALYSGLFSGSYYGGSFLSLPDIVTDNVIVAQEGRKSNLSFYEWRYKSNSAWNMMGSA